MIKKTLKELALITNAELIGDPNYIISGIDNVETASPSDIAFIENSKYHNFLTSSKAGCIIFFEKRNFPLKQNFLIHKNPSLAFQKIIELFIPLPSLLKGIDPTAVLSENVSLGKGVSIGPKATISNGVKIGANTQIGAGCFLGEEVIIGEGCNIHPNVVIRERCIIGNNVVIQPGAVIGSCGFGYIIDEKGVSHRLRQLGIVVIEDDVDIGANTTIDRARFKATIIGKGTKIDNLVQIAHQVTMGENCIIVSQSGIAGSVKMGSNVVIGGQVGIVGHISICNNVAIGSKSGVTKSITSPGMYSGLPSLPHQEAKKILIAQKNLLQLFKKIQKLEQLYQTEKSKL